jgi:hypothetical protein
MSENARGDRQCSTDTTESTKDGEGDRLMNNAFNRMRDAQSERSGDKSGLRSEYIFCIVEYGYPVTCHLIQSESGKVKLRCLPIPRGRVGLIRNWK